MIGNILLKTGLPILIDVVKNSLLSSDNEVTKNAGKALEQITDIPQDKTITKSIAKIEQQDREKISAINKTIQTEINSGDKYVRRMRPTFGYIMALSWFVQMTVIAVSVFLNPSSAGEIISSFAELSMMWSVGLSVLGVYVYKRSGDKK